MKHHVFISYSSYDKMIADAICSNLENHSIQCWIAPKDIIPGMEYALFNTHWLDAMTPPLESHYSTLINTIHHLLNIGDPLPSPLQEPMPRTSYAIVDVAINDPSWIMKTTNGPGLRSGFGMVYDDNSELTILHGGFGHGNEDNHSIASILSISPELNDTWIWEGNTATWSNINTKNTPSTRYSQGMTYDSSRKNVVLSGGAGLSGVPLNDLWEWNGNDWSLLTQHAPPEPRCNHGFVYDKKRNKTILFGGVAGKEYFQDTWELSY